MVDKTASTAVGPGGLSADRRGPGRGAVESRAFWTTALCTKSGFTTRPHARLDRPGKTRRLLPEFSRRAKALVLEHIPYGVLLDESVSLATTQDLPRGLPAQRGDLVGKRSAAAAAIRRRRRPAAGHRAERAVRRAGKSGGCGRLERSVGCESHPAARIPRQLDTPRRRGESRGNRRQATIDAGAANDPGSWQIRAPRAGFAAHVAAAGFIRCAGLNRP